MNFFVTGVTGNVGSSIVRRLLRDSDARIWVLVRASSSEESRDRLQRLFHLWGFVGAELSDVAARVFPLRGDMGLPQFGMTEDDWNAVRSNCDHLIHAAGVVRMNLPIAEARKHAVGSAKNLVALADSISSAGKAVNLAFVSTVGVAGKQREPLPDDWVTHSRSFHNTYEQSKAEAEELLRVWDRGPNVRMTIHRPSMVVGASDGEVLRHQIFFYLCEFLSGRHTKGMQPALNDARLDTVPVDYVADAVCWAVQNPKSDGKVFNLCSGSAHEVGLATVQDWTRQALLRNGQDLPKIRSFPARLFLLIVRATTLTASSKLRKRLGTLPVLIDYLNSPQVFEGGESRQYLYERAELSLPEPEQYLPSIIRSFYV
jgi:thioester reductase-like protein